MKKFTVTKKVAKHGKQSIIILPKVLSFALKPGTVVKVKISVLEQNTQENEQLSCDSQIKAQGGKK